MEVDVSWFAILGFALGIAACLRWIFHDITSFTSRPRLLISHGPFTINWQSIDTDETRRFVHVEARCRRGIARQCTASARIITHPENMTVMQQEFPLHWADTPYSAVSTEAEAVDIKTEARRLDIAFTTSYLGGQSWLAIPLALTVPGKVPQATLPPGEYTLEITVSCENGRGDTVLIKLTSPAEWQHLQAEKA